jgi:hypothetical protein
MHVDDQGVVRSANAPGEVREITFDNLDSMLPGNLLLLLYQETKEQNTNSPPIAFASASTLTRARKTASSGTRR